MTAAPWPATPILALAPMHDITDLPFWRLVHGYGGADLYVTEYMRVHSTAQLTPRVLRAIDENPTGRPVLAQIFGNNPTAMATAARELERHPIAGVDLNLGCPAPMVTRKGSGGGLLRDPAAVDAMLGALREAVQTRLTIKTRLGWSSPDEFEALLPIFARHAPDLVTVHGRTVRQGYGGEVRYDLIAVAARALSCPVLANGDIDSPAAAARVLASTATAGVMIGRGAVRNPWIFAQTRAHLAGRAVELPTGREVLAYVHALLEAVGTELLSEANRVRRVKRCINFLGLGVDGDGRFLHQVRRTKTRAEFLAVCREHLDHDQKMPLAVCPPVTTEPTAATRAIRPLDVPR